jgi:hypothetical protein
MRTVFLEGVPAGEAWPIQGIWPPLGSGYFRSKPSGGLGGAAPSAPLAPCLGAPLRGGHGRQPEICCCANRPLH